MEGEPAGLFLGAWTPGVRLRAMPAMVGTTALDRVLHLVGATTDELQQLLTNSRPGANGVTVPRTCPKPVSARPPSEA